MSSTNGPREPMLQLGDATVNIEEIDTGTAVTIKEYDGQEWKLVSTIILDAQLSQTQRDGLSRTLPEIYKGLKENSNAMNIASPCAYIGDALRSKYDGTDFSLWTDIDADASYYFARVYEVISKLE